MPNSFRRGWWKPWRWSFRTWFVVAFLCVIASPLVLRWICLWQIPDVAVPFNLEEMVLDDIPDSENAFVGYHAAATMLLKRETKWSKGALENALAIEDAKWDDRLDPWLSENSDVLEEFLRSSNMAEGRGVSLRTIHFNSHVTSLLEIRGLARIAEAEALRCERLGDFNEAWIWHRACLRSARHAEMQKFLMSCAVACGIRKSACYGMARWASEPTLTAEQFQMVRREVMIASSTRYPFSEFVKADYIMIQNTLLRPDGMEMVFREGRPTNQVDALRSMVRRYQLWMIGQPEISLRLVRQQIVNNLRQFDRPLSLRQRARPSAEWNVFEIDPRGQRRTGQLSAEELQAHLEGRLGKFLQKAEVLVSFQKMDENARSDTARLSATIVMLACHEYQRLHLEFPETLEQLVPTYLDEIPVDPMDSTGSRLRYQRVSNSEAVVWSLGVNETDDGGDVGGNEPKDIGFRLTLKNRSASNLNESTPGTTGSESILTE